MEYLGYSHAVGWDICAYKLDGLTNREIMDKLEADYGHPVSHEKRVREWRNRYEREHGIVREVNFQNQHKEIEIDIHESESVYLDIQTIFSDIVASVYRRKNASLSIGVVSDVHLPDENPNAMKMAIELLNISQPPIIVLNGDLFSLSTESRYPNTHKAMAEDSFSLSLRKYDKYRAMLNYEPTYELLLCGNHDIRFRECLQGMSASIRNSAIRDFNHQLSSRRLLFGGWDVPQIYYKRQLLIQHGDSTGVNTARNNLLKSGYGFSLSVFGHAHKHQDSVQTSLAGEFASVVSGCIENKSPDYSKTKAPSNFQYGMVFITLFGEEEMPAWSNVKFADHGKKMRTLFGGNIIEVG